jgi:hypothetical protein
LYQYVASGGSFVSHTHLSNLVILIAVLVTALLPVLPSAAGSVRWDLSRTWSAASVLFCASASPGCAER